MNGVRNFWLLFGLSLLCLTGLCQAKPLLEGLSEFASLNECSSKDCKGGRAEDELGGFFGKYKIPCDACNAILPTARDLVKKNDTAGLEVLVRIFCDAAKIEDKVVCHSLIVSYNHIIFAILLDSALSNQDLCSAVLMCSEITNPAFNWTVSLPDYPKPPVQPWVLPKPGSPTLRILHLSDIHVDFEYQPGALATCDQPLCCRNSSTLNQTRHHHDQAKKNASYAGYWGTQADCDIPLWSVEAMFQHISQNEQFDFIYWTGDLPPHNVWNQSRSDQLSAQEILTALFLKYFPGKTIYPALGNHEATPCNLFPPSNIKEDNITWLYTKLAEEWTKTGLPASLAENITRGAFYTIKPAPGVRIVSLNMNYCYNLNFWLYINATDPLDQLKWLADILQESEWAGEKVAILGHVNPMGCLPAWSQNYYRIVNRYESTIAGQFFGHTHTDEFEIFYDPANMTRATSLAYLGGSVTTYNFLNPGYRIYTVDGFYPNTTFQVLDHENYIANITEANKNGKDKLPVWRLEYSAKKAYNLPSLAPQAWADLIEYMLANLSSPLVDALYAFFNKMSDARPGCDLACRKNFVCRFKQAQTGIPTPC